MPDDVDVMRTMGRQAVAVRFARHHSRTDHLPDAVPEHMRPPRTMAFRTARPLGTKTLTILASWLAVGGSVLTVSSLEQSRLASMWSAMSLALMNDAVSP